MTKSPYYMEIIFGKITKKALFSLDEGLSEAAFLIENGSARINEIRVIEKCGGADKIIKTFEREVKRKVRTIKL